MNMEALAAAGGAFSVVLIIVGILLFIAPLAIWFHAARTARAVREHTFVLVRIAEAQEKLEAFLRADAKWRREGDQSETAVDRASRDAEGA